MTLAITREQPRVRGATRKKQKKPSKVFSYIRVLLSLRVWSVIAVFAVTVCLLFFTAVGIQKIRWSVSSVKFNQVLIYEDADAFKQYLSGLVGVNLLTGGLQQVKTDIESFPWIASASLSLEWPGVLQVSVEEEKPLAYWNNSGVVSQTGKIFNSETNSLMLPRLYGPKGSLDTVMQQYVTFSSALLRQGLVLDSLIMTADGGVSLKTESGMEILLGRKDITERFDSVLSVLARSSQYVNQIKYLDARYEHAVALKVNEQQVVSGEETNGRG
ncbi:cell division protein FtsQ/DivIB [Gynuella sp.]|uniref:cell division protein FtsQ/DivIB n=1 Tax=Gynuella sp. TaxID=2969146 RepID=UPI003D137A5F